MIFIWIPVAEFLYCQFRPYSTSSGYLTNWCMRWTESKREGNEKKNTHQTNAYEKNIYVNTIIDSLWVTFTDWVESDYFCMENAYPVCRLVFGGACQSWLHPTISHIFMQSARVAGLDCSFARAHSTPFSTAYKFAIIHSLLLIEQYEGILPDIVYRPWMHIAHIHTQHFMTIIVVGII